MNEKQNIAESLLDFICNNIAVSVVFSLVICMIIAGFVAGWKSLSALKREGELLDTWSSKEKERDESNLEKWLREVWPDDGAPPEKRHFHLNVRIQCILDSLSGGEAEAKTGKSRSGKSSKSGQKELPTLRDLHDLTIHTELSRDWPVWLRTISSSLLILGIIGTLIGVHGVVGAQLKTDLSSLQPALLPSIFAVGGTVVLFFVRGYYVQRLDKFMARLDAITLNKLFVQLRPAHDLNIALSGLAKKVNGFQEGVLQMKAITSTMEKVADKFEEASGKFEECEEKFNSLHEELDKTRENLDTMTIRQGLFQKRADAVLDEVEKAQKDMVAKSVDIFAAADVWTRAADSAAQRWQAASEQAVEQWSDAALKAAQAWVNSAKNWQKSTDAVLGIADSLKELPGLLVQLPTIQQELQRQGENMEKLRENGDELGKSLATVQTTLSSVETSLDDVNKQYTTLTGHVWQAGELVGKAQDSYAKVDTVLSGLQGRGTAVDETLRNIQTCVNAEHNSLKEIAGEHKETIESLGRMAEKLRERRKRA